MNFIQTAEQILALGGHTAFEWPRGCHGWKIPELIAFIKRHNLFVAEPDGCAFGFTDSEGVPHLFFELIAMSTIPRYCEDYHGHSTSLGKE